MRLKFGALDTDTIARVQSGDADQLLVWSEHILSTNTVEDIFQA